MAEVLLRTKQAFSLIEVIISAALIFLMATVFTNAMLTAQQGGAIAGTQARGLLVAQEGLEAVRNIRDYGFSSLVDGTYGISQNAGTWALSGSNDIEDIFTRSVAIQTVDASTKQVTSTVTWQKPNGRTGSVSLSEYLIDTTQLVPEVKKLLVDISGGKVVGSANSRLTGIKIKNLGSGTITLSTTTVQWVGGAAKNIIEIDINGKAVWMQDGTAGYPPGAQPSPATVGLVPVDIANNALPINNFVFDKSVNNAYFIITFIMQDNSSTTITTPVFQ